MTSTALNPRQLQILNYLRQHDQQYSYPPTVREIGRAVGLSSSSTVQSHLNALEEKGYIQRDPTKSRTVKLVEDEGYESSTTFSGSTNTTSIPLVGRVAAGSPILAAENVEGALTVGPEISGGEDAFALTVTGDSMIDAGIHDGDVVIVRPRKVAPNGAIVVARIENSITGESEVTVKRFFKEDDQVRLQPENSSLQPIYTRDLNLEGIVTAVIRILPKN